MFFKGIITTVILSSLTIRANLYCHLMDEEREAQSDYVAQGPTAGQPLFDPRHACLECAL